MIGIFQGLLAEIVAKKPTGMVKMRHFARGVLHNPCVVFVVSSFVLEHF
jgi:hypothetical protein